MGNLTRLDAIVGDETFDLSDRVNYIHLSNEGFGLAPLDRLTERGPLQHGVTDLGFRLQARTIQLVLNLWARSTTDYWARRSELLYIFAPRNTPIQLRFTYLDSIVRQIDCYATGGLSFNSSDKQAYVGHKVAINLQAPDPVFYNPEISNVDFGVVVSSNTFTFPWSFPWNIGSSTLSVTKTITYAGTFEAYPIITVYGPVTDLVITNTTTGDKIDFTGATIANGDVYTIDARYGYKTVTDQTGTNQLSKLTDDSDLATFSIAAKPDAPDGANGFTVTGSSATSVTQVLVSYNEAYIGI